MKLSQKGRKMKEQPANPGWRGKQPFKPCVSLCILYMNFFIIIIIIIMYMAHHKVTSLSMHTKMFVLIVSAHVVLCNIGLHDQPNYDTSTGTYK